jgi:hypothetical protein
MAGKRRWALVAAIAVAGLLALWSGMENRLLYFPTRELSATPAAYGLDAVELTPVAEDGVRLHGWWIKGSGRRALLVFHGNAGNIGDRLDRAKILRERFGLDIFLVDYRGYGRSEGSPSEAGLYRDARAIHAAALASGFRAEDVDLFGESLGCAVAIQLALDRPSGGVVLEAPFLSIAAMAREHYPFVPLFLIRSRFDNAAKIAAIAAPKLIFVAERDTIVPAAQGRRLFELAREPKTLFVIPGAGHNDTYVTGGEPYWAAWEKFLTPSS